MADLHEMVEWLDEYLRIAQVPDYPGAWNGLQVDSRSPVERICVATDAWQATIDGTIDAGAQLLIVHHGLFWGEPLPITGRSFRRIKALVDADVAVYSAHLPLDLHPEVGNNVLLARELNLNVEGTFGRFRDHEGMGVWSAVDVSLDELVARVTAACAGSPSVIRGGPGHVRRVGVVTGGAGSMVGQAHAEGLDTFITGEGSHHTYHEAMELGINLVLAGHYATETLGVRAVGDRLAERFDVESRFLDFPTGL